MPLPTLAQLAPYGGRYLSSLHHATLEFPTERMRDDFLAAFGKELEPHYALEVAAPTLSSEFAHLQWRLHLDPWVA